jgi:FAD/FMN-containing dehydrogenase
MVEAATIPQRTISEISDEAIGAFTAELRGEALRPGDPGFDLARTIFNTMHDREPGMIIRCTGTADVVDAVRFASDNELLLSVRGGGHNVAMNAVCDGGLMIDLTLMNGVMVDEEHRVAYVQGGATWGDLDRETQLYGLATPGGVVTTTGVGGLTLGGGIGWLRAKHGLSCDALIGAEVVTASGEVVHTDASNHPDLFWALRGGGGNFGVVTSMQFELFPVGPLVQVSIPVFPAEQAPELLRAWRVWALQQPDEVTSAAALWQLPTEPPVLPPEIAGRRFLLLPAVYAGDLEQGEQVLASLDEIGEPIMNLGKEQGGAIPFRHMQASFDPFFGEHGQHISYWKSTYVNELSDEVIDICTRRMAEVPDPWTLLNMPTFTGAVQRVGPEETAFGDRSAPFMISIDGNWHDPAKNEEMIAWVRDFWDELQPHATGQIYANFLGEDDDADAALETTRGVYGSNFDRLVDVKTMYDPQNLFHMNQNIRPR